jgi:ligand-binding sensor domain-containing protein
MARKHLTGILAFLLACTCRAQPDLRYLSHQSWTTEEGLPQNSVHAILQTPDGFLWIATEAGLARFDGVSFVVFTHATDPAIPSDDFCCLALDQRGALLAQSADGIVREASGAFTRFTGTMPQASAPAVTGAQLKSRIQTTLIDREHLTWIGTRDGLFLLAPGVPRPIPVAALGGNSILSLFEDAEGNHWVGTETAGLYLLRRSKFRTEPALAELAVTAVVQASDGAMWFGTREDGLRRIAQARMEEPAPVGKLTSGVILSLAPGSHGSVWAGTPDGLNLVSPSGTVKHISSMDGLPDDYIRALAAEPDGSVWIGTQHGLAYWRDGKVTTNFGAKDQTGDAIGSLLFDPAIGVLWAGSAQGLIVSSNLTTRSSPAFQGKVVAALASAPGRGAWTMTEANELFFTTAAGTPFPIRTLPAQPRVTALTPDASGFLWLRTERGIERVAERALEENGHRLGDTAPPTAAPIVLAHYGVADGLPSDEIVGGSPSAGWLARDGEMWFPTRRGVAVADTNHLPIDTLPPPVVIESFTVDGEAVGSAARLPFGRQRFTFDYAGLSFSAPGEVRYRVRLEGFDQDWSDAGNKRTTTYTNLPPGNYRFRVEAVNGDGVWNHTGAQLQFRILAPFYRTWWFILLVLVGLGLMLAGLYLLRLRRLRRGFDAVLAERNRMAREIHDTLTQDFVGTSLQLDIIAGLLRKEKVAQALEQVARTRRLVTEGLEEARQSIWELRANQAEDTLPTRINRLVQREAYATIAPKLRVTGAYRALGARVEREVLRIAQEALSNVLRHALASETRIDLHYSDEALLLTIEDNGRGFDTTGDMPAEGHFGLVGMRERAATIDGKLEVISRKGAGTRVTLRVAVS